MAYPKLISDYYTPRIIWYQTDLTVVIRIQLIDIADYYLRVKDDHLLFSTEKNGKKYHLILYLFGFVISEKTVHRNIGREIKIYLTKTLKWYPWLRLIISKEKKLFISYDADRIQHDEDNNKTKELKFIEGGFEEYKRKNNIRYLMPAGMSSSEEDSEDDDNFDYFRYA